ncbi:hypothetical protein [Paenibacillus periandrae]|uniref:hypothetical protein n=1 Tax=Paenibacillus periandrae TaxID=1761741 RepID=UPI001F09167F|nr:hypothetical protein [Paenibacillus periandrae]
MKWTTQNRPVAVDRETFIDFMYVRSSNEVESEVVDLYDNEYIIFYQIPERSSELSIFEYTAAIWRIICNPLSTYALGADTVRAVGRQAAAAACIRFQHEA